MFKITASEKKMVLKRRSLAKEFSADQEEAIESLQ